MTKNITKLLIANRGEIAVRIQDTAHQLGITTVAIHAQDDANALFVQLADEAYLLEGHSLAETYLNIEKIISIAQRSGANAIHPGYGFLSENAAFANACAENNITFVGPSAASIELMGDKIASRHFAEQAGLPLLKGITGTHAELLAQADQLDFPVIIKAAAGGGGKGMRIVHSPQELPDTLEATAREAKSYFGDDAVFIEKYIQQPRHIEVQVLGDTHGNVIHLFERECTIQRRHQKIIEEAPSITLNENVRAQITQAAVNLAKAANYHSAGTVEFIMDEELKFYFMEMNTRIQVEHPVTELITGVDIVEQQIRIAEGNELPFTQQNITRNGHAVEARIYAEDPANNFRPAPGTLAVYKEPETENTRIDSGLDSPGEISGKYDPMISKLTTWAEDRNQALHTLNDALKEYTIHGIETNVNYLQAIVTDTQFITNNISTNYCKTETERLLQARLNEKNNLPKENVVLAFLLAELCTIPDETNLTVWQQIPSFSPVGLNTLFVDNQEVPLQHIQVKNNVLKVHALGEQLNGEITFIDDEFIQFKTQGKVEHASVFSITENTSVVALQGHHFVCTRNDVLNEHTNYQSNAAEAGGNSITSPIPGTVIKIYHPEQTEVKKGDKLIIVEAMKMENTFSAPFDGVIKTISVQEQDKVEAGKILIELQPKESE